MRNLNRVTMIGQLTADPEAKMLASGQAMTAFGLATNYSWKDAEGEWKDGVDFHKVVAWKKLAVKVSDQYKKGDKIFLEGKLRSRSWEAEDGTKRGATEIVAYNVVPMTSTEAKKKAAEVEELPVEEAWEREEVEIVATTA